MDGDENAARFCAAKRWEEHNWGPLSVTKYMGSFPFDAIHFTIYNASVASVSHRPMKISCAQVHRATDFAPAFVSAGCEPHVLCRIGWVPGKGSHAFRRTKKSLFLYFLFERNAKQNAYESVHFVCARAVCVEGGTTAFF